MKKGGQADERNRSDILKMPKQSTLRTIQDLLRAKDISPEMLTATAAVKNRDGTVNLEFQGKPEVIDAMNKLLIRVHEENPGIKVTDVEWETAKEPQLKLWTADERKKRSKPKSDTPKFP